MIKFRWHRGGLKESMDTVVEIEPTMVSLHKEIVKVFPSLSNKPITIEDITVDPYTYDERIFWDTYIVCVRGCGMGFTDGPVK